MNSIKFRLFLLFKIPIAFIAGLRLASIDDHRTQLHIKHSWINQNPFNSMYFAVQAMIAEISTGLLVFRHIEKNKANISMLVTQQEAIFTKKAVGRLEFTCQQGDEISNAIIKTIETKEGQTVWVESIGVDSNGDMVSKFRFEWSIKARA